jgi:DNA-binding Lrp family transcriptional regulator
MTPARKGKAGKKAFELDERDEEILRALRKDGRASVRSVSAATGIRPSTVHSRMEKLVKGGVIEGFTIRENPELSARQLTVFMLVTGSTGKYLDDSMLRDSCVEEVHGITGEYDLLLKLRFRDLKEFNRFVIDFREKHKGDVTRTVTMVETARVK